MRVWLGCLLMALLGIAGAVRAQESPTYTLRTSTNLVVLDVVVTGADGKPVHGLDVKSLVVKEDGKTQSIRSFTEHTAAEVKPMRPAPKLAAGIFTNFAAAADGPVNVVLLDMLNTPLRDQAYAREQIQKYLEHVPEGTRVAIFGLGNSLVLLQGFTSDPAVLKLAMARKNAVQGSSQLDDPLGGGGGGTGEAGIADNIADMGTSPDIAEAVANAQQFQADTQSFQMQLRAQITLDGLNELARYLSNLPGRKNLIWFSGSFPASVLPNADVANGFATMQSAEQEFRETMDLLARNQVALYPVDARGLQTTDTFNAANGNQKYARDPQAMGKDIAKFNMEKEQTSQSMLQAARATGGEAFLNTNGLTAAIAKAVNDGSNYYTLTYSPANKVYDGRYRAIEVSAPGKNVTLNYRRGYYSDDPAKPVTVGTKAAPVADLAAKSAMTRSLMRGAPPATQIEFTVQVRPATGVAEDSAAAGNEVLVPQKKFVRYTVDFAVDPAAFVFDASASGFQDGIQFVAFVYDSQGTLVTRTGSVLHANLSPQVHADFLRHPLSYNLDISAPETGAYFLRLAVQDLNSQKVGAIEVPLEAVRKLAAVGAR